MSIIIHLKLEWMLYPPMKSEDRGRFLQESLMFCSYGANSPARVRIVINCWGGGVNCMVHKLRMVKGAVLTRFDTPTLEPLPAASIGRRLCARRPDVDAASVDAANYTDTRDGNMEHNIGASRDWYHCSAFADRCNINLLNVHCSELHIVPARLNSILKRFLFLSWKILLVMLLIPLKIICCL